MDNSSDIKTSWSSFVKVGQTDMYTRNGGKYGAISGAAIAAIISAIKYGKGKKHQKESVFNRIMKGLLWTGAGALGGGLLGAGIGRLIGSHVEYSRSLKKAKEILAERRNNGHEDRIGRVLLVNFPKNKMLVGDHELEKGLPKWVGPKYRDWLKKHFNDGITIQHAALITMDDDGGNARIFDVSDSSSKESGMRFAEKFVTGARGGDKDKELGGNYGLENDNTWAKLKEHYIGDAFKGKSNQQIADMLARYGAAEDYGGSVDLYEGRKGVNVDLVHAFIEARHDRANGYGSTGYTIIPGGYNCGTSSREGFDSVQSPWSHFLDSICGGFPSQNMPMMANHVSSNNGTQKDTPELDVISEKDRFRGDEFTYLGGEK